MKPTRIRPVTAIRNFRPMEEQNNLPGRLITKQGNSWVETCAGSAIQTQRLNQVKAPGGGPKGEPPLLANLTRQRSKTVAGKPAASA
jgi:hypothetical protein